MRALVLGLTLTAAVVSGCGGSSGSGSGPLADAAPTPTASPSPTPSPSPSVVVVAGIPIEIHRPFTKGISTILYTLNGNKQTFVAHDSLLTLGIAGVHLLGNGRMDIAFTPATQVALRKLGGGTVFPTWKDYVLTTTTPAQLAKGHLIITVPPDSARVVAEQIAGPAPVT